jgi:hypothetical protein
LCEELVQAAGNECEHSRRSPRKDRPEYHFGAWERTFSKKAVSTGTTCNTARAYGEGPCGELLIDESNTICINLRITSGSNLDTVVVGRQYAFSSGSDSPTASNAAEIKKNQIINGQKQNNTKNICLGDQKADGISMGQSSNAIKIVSNQE